MYATKQAHMTRDNCSLTHALVSFCQDNDFSDDDGVILIESLDVISEYIF